MSRTEQSMHALLQESHLAGAHDVPGLVQRYAQGLAAPETLRRVVRALLKHQAGGLTDDATLLLVEWQGFEKPTIRMS